MQACLQVAAADMQTAFKLSPMGRALGVLTGNLTVGAGAGTVTMLCLMTIRNLRAGDTGVTEQLCLLLSLSACSCICWLE